MSSAIDVCNLALSRLGDRATVASIDPPEGSAQASHCAQFYPIARDVALEAHAWGFNTVRSSDAPILVNPQPGWLYAYAVPNDCLKVLRIVPLEFADQWWSQEPAEYTRESEELTGMHVLLTNVANAAIVYQRRIDDAALFPPTFVSALSWLLASYLAGPVVKGEAGRKASVTAYQAWQGEMKTAAGLDANQSKKRRRRVPDAVAARGGYGGAVPDAPIIGTYGWYAFPDGLSGNG